MFTKKTIRDYDFAGGKRVLLTVDFNVPVNDDGTVIDDYRIRQTLPTLQYLIDQNCSLVLIGHLGRPKSRDDQKTSFRLFTVMITNIFKKSDHTRLQMLSNKCGFFSYAVFSKQHFSAE